MAALDQEGSEERKDACIGAGKGPPVATLTDYHGTVGVWSLYASLGPATERDGTVPYALSPCPAIRAGDTVRYSPWGRDDTAEATVVVFIVGRVGNGSRGVLRRRFALLRCSDGVLDHTVLMGRQPKCALTFLVGREDGFNFQLSDIERAFLVRSKVHHLSKAEQRLSSTDRKEKRRLEQKTYRTGVVHAKVEELLRDPSDEGYTSSNDECKSSKPNRQEWGQSSLNSGWLDSLLEKPPPLEQPPPSSLAPPPAAAAASAPAPAL